MMARDYGFAGAVYNVLREIWKGLFKAIVSIAIGIVGLCYVLTIHNSLLLIPVFLYMLGFCPVYLTWLMIHDIDKECLLESEDISEDGTEGQIKKLYSEGKINSFDYTEKMARL